MSTSPRTVVKIELSDSDKDHNTTNTSKSIQFNTKREIVKEHKLCKQPNYKNINGYMLTNVTIVFLICQLFTFYCLENTSYLQHNLIDIRHYSWVNSLTVLVSLTVINIKHRQKRDTTLIKGAILLTLVACLLSLSYDGWLFQKSVDLQNKQSTLIMDIISTIYSFAIVITASISLACQLVGSFCYFIKCIPKTNDNGLIVAIFLVSTIIGQSLYEMFDSVKLGYGIQIVLYCGAITMLILSIFISKILPIPSFNDEVLDIDTVVTHDQKIDAMMCQQIDSYTNETVNIQKNTSKIPKWLEFYYFVLFKTSNGLSLLIQSAIYSFFESMLGSYSEIKNIEQVYKCRTQQQSYSKIFMECLDDQFLFKHLKFITIIIQSITTLGVGYIYDLLIQFGLEKYLTVFRFYQVLALLCAISLCIPSMVGLDYDGFRDIFIIILIVLQSFSHILVRLNLIIMFTGGYRIAVCMVFSFIFFFTLIFDLMKFSQEFVGNGIIELIIFAIMMCGYFILKSRTKE
ncbi:Conserved_hypothetical protein [Hexamita inflata]|uniref:Uncharacterized protein n=1 Tax=Hexamita inflata TaxID=28002 RepID=A0AA86RHP7_9EUKA|nr:Conserved hypothetical protein [Hexamita inflata]